MVNNLPVTAILSIKWRNAFIIAQKAVDRKQVEARDMIGYNIQSSTTALAYRRAQSS
jgi:hypothetical protein